MRVLWVDASYVINGFKAHISLKRASFEQGSNGDLWCEIYSILDAFGADPNAAPTFIYKVKSHETIAQSAARGTPSLVGSSTLVPTPLPATSHTTTNFP